ncbi:uncharacterized protein A4U43_C03F12210 [Asparagus officinalis]|uniref:Uncharacterized protein n=1 Tax=Asparagus officinalis TaxID=4686 RepID=A0A5P1FA69_ASPOF|nr:homeobox-leucine zipper protein ROC8-like isoform X1 [Asparagus officinalis]XP_020256823.1 homeobox-leucine zipper protein ROC8-like isoform X2 [Asparagus officinalis]ONK74994.1 uncharacterized protein A4U43_C03F12210 [Asparagus officinalis]
MSSGDEQDAQERRKKRYHRHTPRQIQELEGMFKLCPHPDEKQRMRLSRDLGLEPKQIKFWFQNRRTQMKAQHERQDNCSLRAENDKIRCENIAMREALKNIICPNCGGPPVNEDSYFDEQKLRMENARLKEELDRVSSITSKYLGRPITQLPPIQPVSVSSLDLSVGGFVNPGFGPSLDLDLLSGSSSSIPFPFPAPLSDIEKPIMAELATNAMEELIRLVQTDEPLWIKPGTDGREVLHLETYDRIFSKPGHQFLGPDTRVEASRDSGVVFMSPGALVDMFMDSVKWMELFPTIVSNARNIEVLASGMGGSRSGSLILMYGEFQILSPVVPTREFLFLRYCQQIDHSSWVVTDVSVDFPRDPNLLGPPSRNRRLPSGCLIQEMPNGHSKVSWVEHTEIEDKNQTLGLFQDLVHSGMAFGAQRWVTTLLRMCERFHCLMGTGADTRDLVGVIPTPEGRMSMMKLSQRMLNIFCNSLCPSNGHQWNTLSGLNEVRVRFIPHKSADPGQPNGVVLSAATSTWLPLSCQRVFSFFKDERTRAQWDVLSNGNMVQEVTNITTGLNPGNSISLLRALTPDQNSMLILQESCTDASGSIVVYAPVNLQSMDIVMSGEDTSYIPLLPSGFAILPDGRPSNGLAASTSSNPISGSSGSLLTITFQILMSSLPTAKLNTESVESVNRLISETVHNIKAALNCP